MRGDTEIYLLLLLRILRMLLVVPCGCSVSPIDIRYQASGVQYAAQTRSIWGDSSSVRVGSPAVLVIEIKKTQGSICLEDFVLVHTREQSCIQDLNDSPVNFVRRSEKYFFVRVRVDSPLPRKCIGRFLSTLLLLLLLLCCLLLVLRLQRHSSSNNQPQQQQRCLLLLLCCCCCCFRSCAATAVAAIAFM